jgi:THO complex subunit 1
LTPPERDDLGVRLRHRGSDTEEKIQERLAIGALELEQAKVEGFHDKIFINGDLDSTYKELESYIFELDKDTVDEGIHAVPEIVGKNPSEAMGTEVEMAGNNIPHSEGP